MDRYTEKDNGVGDLESIEDVCDLRVHKWWHVAVIWGGGIIMRRLSVDRYRARKADLYP